MYIFVSVVESKGKENLQSESCIAIFSIDFSKTVFVYLFLFLLCFVSSQFLLLFHFHFCPVVLFVVCFVVLSCPTFIIQFLHHVFMLLLLLCSKLQRLTQLSNQQNISPLWLGRVNSVVCSVCRFCCWFYLLPFAYEFFILIQSSKQMTALLGISKRNW